MKKKTRKKAEETPNFVDYQDVICDIEKWDLETLRNLNRDVVGLIRAKRHNESQRKIYSFNVGDKVKSSNLRKSVEGKIIKINRTRIVVEDKATGVQWNIPAANLEACNEREEI
jgi:hypothetical protein